MITQIAPLRWLLQGFSTVKLLFLLLQLISILSGNTLRPRKYTIPHQMLRIFSYLFIIVLTHHFTIPWVIIHYCHYLFWCLNGLRFGWWVPIQAGFSVISYKTIILFFWLKYSWCTISCKLKSSFFDDFFAMWTRCSRHILYFPGISHLSNEALILLVKGGI